MYFKFLGFGSCGGLVFGSVPVFRVRVESCGCWVMFWLSGGPLAISWPRVRFVPSGGFGLDPKVWLLRFSFCGGEV